MPSIFVKYVHKIQPIYSSARIDILNACSFIITSVKLVLNNVCYFNYWVLVLLFFACSPNEYTSDDGMLELWFCLI